MVKKNYVRMCDGVYWSCFLHEWVEMHHSYINAYKFKYAYYRYPKTFNEKKANDGALVDGVQVRAKRKPKVLISCWDDKMFSRNWKKSWKDFTKNKKQWMKK